MKNVIIYSDKSEPKIKTLLENIDDLDFEKNDGLKAWEKVSAAIGFAEYDSKIDSKVVDVFKRADQKMYDDKREMKAKMKG